MSEVLTTGLTERALIARHVAALRRFGWSTQKALSHVADLAPPGRAQRLLRAYGTVLANGQASPADPADPLLQLLVQGERAGPEVLEEAGRGLELEAQAVAAAAAAFRYSLVALVAGLSLLCLFAYGVAPTFAALYESFGTQLPRATQAVLAVMEGARYGAPLLLIGLVWFWQRRPWIARLPGVRGLRRAARLRTFAAAVDAGLDDATALSLAGSTGARDLTTAPGLGLDPLERRLAAELMEREGPSAAARVIAREIEIRQEKLWRSTVMQGPVLILMVTLTIGAALVSPLLLPIFNLVGAR